MAAIEPEGIFEVVEALASGLVPRVGKPAIGLEQSGRTKETVAIPPVARTAGSAAEAQNALIVAVQFRSLLR